VHENLDPKQKPSAEKPSTKETLFGMGIPEEGNFVNDDAVDLEFETSEMKIERRVVIKKDEENI